MARKKDSAFDALVAMATMLPLQAALITVTCFIFHHFVGLLPIPITIVGADGISQTIGDSMTRQMVISHHVRFSLTLNTVLPQ
jgi:hypothetical protein